MPPTVHSDATDGSLHKKQKTEVQDSPQNPPAGTQFFIFGDPVQLSASPVIHNAGFEAVGLSSWQYGRCNTADVSEFMEKLKEPSTGGGSVTIPLKEVILDQMDSLSSEAQAIGAVNTVIKQPDGSLHGENTDWLGIKGQLEPLLEDQAREGERVALVIGAGGTAQAACYAFQQMKFSKVVVYNRTVERAQAVCSKYGVEVFEVISDLNAISTMERLDAVMSTVPGSAGVVLPDGILAKLQPVVIDAAYKSSDKGERLTALLSSAKQAGCPVVEGMEMLFEQGCAQFGMWTAREPPRALIAQALLDARFADDADPPEHLVAEASRSSGL